MEEAQKKKEENALAERAKVNNMSSEQREKYEEKQRKR